ncbi:hypothetical protein [Clostridium ljungdahlii]|uniref:Uncharacterized protein n=1 Tax=Clostridium ljungdahlii (strain ATCC 55383 / DSM 13528 / PETC) TaxID=748727 RepID=A0ABX2TYI6_CLOLD|nr:hypothetical protein [Clostridium ljungdahlii]OAA89432.1 hypothetical protein WX45_01264 [Clostridium ljungdahlii DSM 13528]
MNLIEAVIKKVIKRREFNSTIEWNLDNNDELYNIDFIEFECITEDMGGCQKELLIYKKSECRDIKEGYVFLH